MKLTKEAIEQLASKAIPHILEKNKYGESKTIPPGQLNPHGFKKTLAKRNAFTKGYQQCQKDEAYDYSKDCKCGDSRIGETWCCNQCGLPTVRKEKDNWISVEDRFPNEGKRFLCSDGYSIQYRLAFWKGKSKEDFIFWKHIDLPKQIGGSGE